MSDGGGEGVTHMPGEQDTSAITRPGRVLRALARRWPTVLAVALAGFTVSRTGAGDPTYRLAETLLFLPLLYLVVAAVGRRSLTWVFLVAGIALLAGVRVLGWIDPPVVIFAAALAATVWGAVRRRFREGSSFAVQIIGMVLFAAVAVLAMAVDTDLSRYLVAAGWLAHGVWDFVHLRRDRVVSRSYAEWCGVVDILVAAQLVVLPVLR
jgi:hypothetical protein